MLYVGEDWVGARSSMMCEDRNEMIITMTSAKLLILC